MKIVRLRDSEVEHAHRHFRKRAVEVPRDVDGYALVWFRRDRRERTVEVSATYSCRDSADVMLLPSMSEFELRRQIMKEGCDDA